MTRAKTPRGKAAPAPKVLPTSQTGPAQGADPAVVLAQPDSGATREGMDDAEAMQLAQDNGAGPRQEPVHQSSPPVADAEGLAKLEQDDGRHAHPKHGKMSKDTEGRLADALMKAHETNGVVTETDDFGRTFTFYQTNMNNQSVVMATAANPGSNPVQVPISTSQLSTEDGRRHAVEAIGALHEGAK